jgi:hypothetical protein
MGVARPWHAAVLYNRDPRLAHRLMALLNAEKEFTVGDKLERVFLDEEHEEEKAIIRATEQEKRPGINPGPSSFRLKMSLVVHAAHAAARHSRDARVLLRPFGDHGFRGN